MYLARNNEPLALLARALAAVLACWAFAAGAQDLIERPAPIIQSDQGRFEVRDANVQLDDGVYYLNAWVEYQLSSEARAALRSGVPPARASGRARASPTSSGDTS